MKECQEGKNHKVGVHIEVSASISFSDRLVSCLELYLRKRGFRVSAKGYKHAIKSCGQQILYDTRFMFPWTNTL